MRHVLKIIAGFIFIVSYQASADQYDDLRKTIEEENTRYKNVSCEKGKSEHTVKLTYGEICKYGRECPIQKKSQVAYCREELLSQCFEKKKWLTSNNFFGLPESTEVKETETRKQVTMLNGKANRVFLHCAYYD